MMFMVGLNYLITFNVARSMVMINLVIARDTTNFKTMIKNVCSRSEYASRKSIITTTSDAVTKWSAMFP